MRGPMLLQNVSCRKSKSIRWFMIRHYSSRINIVCRVPSWLVIRNVGLPLKNVNKTIVTEVTMSAIKLNTVI